MKAVLALVALASFAMAAPAKEGAQKTSVTESDVSPMENISEFDFYAGKSYSLYQPVAMLTLPDQPLTPSRPRPGAADTAPPGATTFATGTVPTPGSAPAGLAAASTKRATLTRPRVGDKMPSSVAAAPHDNTLPGYPEEPKGGCKPQDRSYLPRLECWWLIGGRKSCF